ncbi:heavy-metal-associated domain-containing protein [Celeribacter arenosi]|uniref:HMA domain-containing protein n=1 Tax=Celeribacter arenosi TaxID=792649 RepID=A0ABP7K442_9RHOB
MSVFSVPDMSCSHCVTTITEALEAVDDAIEVTPDLEKRSILIRTQAGDEAVMKALLDAGYPAQKQS